MTPPLSCPTPTWLRTPNTERARSCEPKSSLTKTWTDSPSPIETPGREPCDEVKNYPCPTPCPETEVLPNFNTLKDSLKRSGKLIDNLWNLHDKRYRLSESPTAEPPLTLDKVVKRNLQVELNHVNSPTGLVSTRVDFFNNNRGTARPSTNPPTEGVTYPTTRTGMIPLGSNPKSHGTGYNATPAPWARSSIPHNIWIKTGDFIARDCLINDFADPSPNLTPKPRGISLEHRTS